MFKLTCEISELITEYKTLSTPFFSVYVNIPSQIHMMLYCK